MLIRSIKKQRSGEAGFTLVELLVVIAILGILAAIVVFAVGGITNRGQSSANTTECSVLDAAEEAYFGQHSAYTASQTDLKNAGLIRDVSTVAHVITLVPGPPADYTISNCT